MLLWSSLGVISLSYGVIVGNSPWSGDAFTAHGVFLYAHSCNNLNYVAECDN